MISSKLVKHIKSVTTKQGERKHTMQKENVFIAKLSNNKKNVVRKYDNGIVCNILF